MLSASQLCGETVESWTEEDDGDKKLCGHPSEQSSMLLSTCSSQPVDKAVRVVFLFRLDIALGANVVRIHPFPFFCRVHGRAK